MSIRHQSRESLYNSNEVSSSEAVPSQARIGGGWPLWAHWLVLVALVVGGGCITLFFYRITYDDVFLAFRYVKNILSGHGFVFNPGERFLGTPAPLFVGLLVVGKVLLPWLSIPEIGGVLSGLSLMGCSIFVYLLGKEYRQPVAGALGAVLTLLSPFVVMTLGSETPIFLMLACAAFYTYARGRYNLSAFLLALAVLNRSEGIIAAGVIGAHFLLTQRRLPLKPLMVFALTLVPWVTYATIQFGSPLSHSLGAKLAQRQIGHPPFTPAAAWWARHVTLRNSPWALALVLLAGLGGLAILRDWRRWGPFFAWIVGQSLGYLVLDVPFYHWYIAHLGVGLAVAVGLGFWWAVDVLLSAGAGIVATLEVSPLGLRWTMDMLSPDNSEVFHAASRWRRLTYGFLRGGCALLLVSLICAALALSFRCVRHYWLGEPSPSNRIYVKAGKWLREHTPPGSSVAYIEIGQIAYYSDQPVVDLLGLVTPGAAERLERGNFLWAYQFYAPDYVLYNDVFAGWMHPAVAQPWFREAYEVIGEIEEPGYPSPLTVYHKREGVVLPPPVEVDVAQLRFERSDQLHEETRLGQTFEALSPNLCGVEVLLATFGRENRWPVTFHLTSASDPGRDLICQEIPPSAVKNNAWYGIFFPSLVDSEDQSYYFYFEAPDVPVDEPLALWSSSGDTYPAGTVMLDGQPGNIDLAFKAYICPGQDVQPSQ
jgi:hypothetical protein